MHGVWRNDKEICVNYIWRSGRWYAKHSMWRTRKQHTNFDWVKMLHCLGQNSNPWDGKINWFTLNVPSLAFQRWSPFVCNHDGSKVTYTRSQSEQPIRACPVSRFYFSQSFVAISYKIVNKSESKSTKWKRKSEYKKTYSGCSAMLSSLLPSLDSCTLLVLPSTPLLSLIPGKWPETSFECKTLRFGGGVLL